MTDLAERFQELLKKQNLINTEITKYKTLYEINAKKLADLEKEVRDKGYDPDKLDEEIINLEAKITKDLSNLEGQLSTASAIIDELKNL